MVKEVVEPMLDEGQPKEKLQEPYRYGKWMEWKRMENETVSRDGSPSCPYMESGARARYKAEVPPIEGLKS
jgi:hypothetical protein